MQTDLIGQRVIYRGGKCGTIRAVAFQQNTSGMHFGWNVLIEHDESGHLHCARSGDVCLVDEEPTPPTPFLGRQDHTEGREVRCGGDAA